MLDTSFIADASPATDAGSDLTIASPSEPTPTAPADAGQPLEAPATPAQGITSPDPAAPVAPAEGIAPTPGAITPNDEEAEFQKALDDPSTPAFARTQIQRAMQYAGKLKAEREAARTEFDTFRSQYEGKEALSTQDIERLRQAEDTTLKLSSFSSTPEDVVGSLKELLGDQKLAAVKNTLAWEFLENTDGTPDLESLQIIVDRFSGHKDGETQVLAKDVISAITALKAGVLEPYQLHQFETDEEFEAHKRARGVNAEAEQIRAVAKANSEYQERATRTQVLQGVVGNIQSQFQPQVENLLSKFHLNSAADDPKVAVELKQGIQEKIVALTQKAISDNRYLAETFKAIQFLGNPTGVDAQAIQNEVNGYVSSHGYQTNLARGISELVTDIEKVVTQEAYRYKLAMMGYEIETSKGQNAREVLGSPAASAALPNLTPEQLSSMSSDDRRRHVLKSVSDSFRAPTASPYGG